MKNSLGKVAIVLGIALFAYAFGYIHARIRSADSPTWWAAIFNQSSDRHESGNSDRGSHEPSRASAFRTLELSLAARKNLGLTDEYLKPIEATPYSKTLTVPGLIVDRPGRTRLPVSSAMTGMVTHVHAVAGEAIEAGDLILEMRLTHEDLVTAQKDFLQSLGNLDVELKEIDRLDAASRQGALSNKTLLEREYNRDKLESVIRAQREALRLHGLTDTQLDAIVTDRRLLTEIHVYAPNPDDHSDDEIQLSDAGAVKTAIAHRVLAGPRQVLVLQELNVQKGQIVSAGELLCTLADYHTLLIEGQSFENEISRITTAKRLGWPVTAVLENSTETEIVDNLQLGWLENEVDPKSRTLRFYVPFPNHLELDEKSANGQRFIEWKYRVGQRIQLRVPIEQWDSTFVLPIDAVVKDGADSFVFRWNGDRFERVPILERFRDQSSVVVEPNGTISKGDVIVLRGSHQMQLALQSQTSRPIDPHAGHNH